MSKLPSKIAVPIWQGEERLLSFERTEEIIQWAKAQIEAWNIGSPSSNNFLRQQWEQQQNAFNAVSSQANQIDSLLQSAASQNQQPQLNNSLKQLGTALNQFAQGTALTTDHKNFRYIAQLAETDRDAATALLIASRSNGTAVFQQAIQHNAIPLDAIARISTGILDGKHNKSFQTHNKDLASLKNRFDNDLSTLRAALEQTTEQSKQIGSEHASEVSAHSKTFSDLLQTCQDEWNDLKRIYDVKLGLLAPTEYWGSRASQYKKQAWWFTAAFAIALALLIGLFAWLGIGELKNSKAESVTLVVLPVIVPLFAGVWVLRILGRQLSESLMIMKDAQERETLVKTFLALMRDDTTGKSVVKDEDRALILQALFRQSRVTATDDSPPINTIEAIFKKG